MLLRLGLPSRNVSASGLGDLCDCGPVADATGKDVPASGLKRLIGIEAPVADLHRQGCAGLRPGEVVWG